MQVPRNAPGPSRACCSRSIPIERRLGELADTVESAYQRYGEKARLREPLKDSFTLTLTLVLLLSLFAALYGAFWAARRLVRPIQDLVAGTRAVAKGDFDMRLPLTSHDEMGILVHSFNDMTKRLARAREETRPQSAGGRSRTREPRGHSGAPVHGRDLARTGSDDSHRESSGRRDSGYRYRSAASASPSIEAGAGSPLFQQFGQPAAAHLDAGESEWREQLVLQGEAGRRVLMCACTTLSGEDQSSARVRHRVR